MIGVLSAAGDSTGEDVPRNCVERSGPPPGDGARDGLELSLVRVNELIESAIEEHRRRSARRSAAVVQSVDDPLPTARKLAARARRSIALTVSDAADATTLCPPVGGGETVAVRLLCGPRTLAGGQLRDVLRQRPDLQLRLSRNPVRGALLVDGEVALVRCAPGTADPASVIRSPVLVFALEALFVAAWARAAPVRGSSRPRQGAHADLARAVLTQLCAGDTDSQAARRLGVSLRTYRRRVAAIMQELGAESRFQAGALAVEAGLLPVSA